MFSSKEVELMRRQLWIEAAAQCVNANDCKQTSTPVTYADAILKAFDQRFGAEKTCIINGSPTSGMLNGTIVMLPTDTKSGVSLGKN